MGEKSSWDWERELPIYSRGTVKHIREEDLDDPFAEEKKQREPITKCWWQRKKEKLIRDHALTVIIMFLWGASLIGGCCITGTIMYHNGFNDGWDAKCEEIKRQEIAKKEAADSDAFLSDEKSRQNAIDKYKTLLAIHAGSLRMERGVTPEGIETYLWVDMTRYLSGLYGKELWDVLISDQIECFIIGHSFGPEDEEIAERVATMIVDNQRPRRYRNDLFYAEINADGSVTARNELHTSSKTKFWSIEY